MNAITLTTDFGLSDWFVGTLRGVILRLAPGLPVIDLSHGVPAGDIVAGAFTLASSIPFFPPGCVHVAVIDPGVGSARPAIAVESDGSWFVGPDNGLLSWALRDRPIGRIRRLENQQLFLPVVSQTFHGRDIFAPVAARLATGLDPAELGPEASDFIRLPWPGLQRHDDRLEGGIVHVDHFGNALTNLPNDLTQGPRPVAALLSGSLRIPIATCYADVPAGTPVAVPGSTGYLEIAINRGHAARTLQLVRGQSLQAEFSRPSP